MPKSDTESDDTDLESPSQDDSSTSFQQTLKLTWPGTQGNWHALFFASIFAFLVFTLGLGLYSLSHLEDSRLGDDSEIQPEDDDLAFDMRPDYKIETPTVSPSDADVKTKSPNVFDPNREDLLKELRYTFGQEIGIKIQSHNSPMNLAYHWIVDQDEYSNGATVQRFLLAAFYFATGGRRATATWSACSAVPAVTQEDEVHDSSLPIRCVFEGGQSVCALHQEFLECPEYYHGWETRPPVPKKRWLSNSFECDWYGISCNHDGSVYEISLPNNGLDGSLIPELTALDNLTRINLDHNSIGGSIANLNKMDIQELSLGWNSLGGNLELSDQWVNLRRLVLGDGNNINISINARFGLIENLEMLDLSGNHIASELPDQIAYNWGALTDLKLADCDLFGTLPNGLIGLSSVVSLDIHNNRFTGTLPTSLWSMLRLESLRLEFNDFQGTLSSAIGNLLNLQKISIVDTGLTGVLPQELSKLQQLESASLQHNAFIDVPDAICTQMPALHTLEADCGTPGMACSCCTLCCDPLFDDPSKCHAQ